MGACVHVYTQVHVNVCVCTNQSLLLRFIISSVRYSLGVSETFFGQFRGRDLVKNNYPIVRNVRRELFSINVASNLIYGEPLGDKKRPKPT